MSYRHLLSEDSVMIKCVYDGCYYAVEDMVYEEGMCNWIAKDNIEAHLKSLIGNVEANELERFINNLISQLWQNQ